jgi:hypothetical protein
MLEIKSTIKFVDPTIVSAIETRDERMGGTTLASEPRHEFQVATPCGRHFTGDVNELSK